MKTVRLKQRMGPFIAGQRVQVFSETDDGLYLKGASLNPMDRMAEVAFGPVHPDEVEEYVPEVPLKPLEERVKEVWP